MVKSGRRLPRRRFVGAMVAIGMGSIIAGPLAAQDGEPANPDQLGANERWPRQFEFENGGSLVVYQPQIDVWPDFERLEAVVAVAVTLPGSDEETYGALVMAAGTEVDLADRLVTLRDIHLSKVSFPALYGESATFAEEHARRVFPTGPIDISLDRMLVNLLRNDVADADVEVSHAPPKIILHEKDSLLVRIDGSPIFERVGGDLQLVVNTVSDLFHLESTGRYYLMRGKYWFEAPDLDGPWTVNRELPEPFFRMPRTARLRDVRNGVRGRSVAALNNAPDVFVSQEPAELIVIHGKPAFKPIPGTALDYVTNTEGDLFRSGSDAKYYALLSGRWFRKNVGEDDPLEYCTTDLPADFAKIPADHERGRVLASVPGTPQAREAVIAARIPRTATIDRQYASFHGTYHGDPEFAAIEGTDVEYAVNTSFEILRVGDRYLACHQAVWFESDDAQGPWKVCDGVPDAIYGIPTSSRFHPLTYVFVYDSDPEQVVAGYLPGYEHTLVNDGVLVYGLGYDYDLPGSYYAHRHRAWSEGNFAYLRLRDTYGHGHHYDHLAGTFRRSREAREHEAMHQALVDPYEAWGGAGVTPRHHGGDEAMASTGGGFRGVVVLGRPDVYATREGQVYQRSNEAWLRYDNGQWSLPAGATPRAAPPPSFVAQGRSWGNQRESQYRRYRSTRSKSISSGFRLGGS